MGASLDGFRPREMTLLSRRAGERIAVLLNQIERGAPWPRIIRLAKVVFLEKIGAIPGKAMSYRPLTITASLYRCWASMRLEDCQHWGHLLGV